MAPQSAQTDALRARDLFLYAMKKGVSVVIGGHVVEVVTGVHQVVGAQLDCAKYTRDKTERGRLVFENWKEKKWRQI